MKSIAPHKSDGHVVAHKTDGNPEGKGVSGFLLDWCKTEPRGVVAKPQPQVLAEVFTSMLVLSASFKFRPAVGVATYLYWVDDEWSLSLIAPAEWTAARRAGFAGTCVLQPDMTWTIIPSDRLAADTPVADALSRFYDGFALMLNTDLTLEEILPFYVGKLAYYQRLHASALSRSVRATVNLGGQGSMSCRQWTRQLPRQKTALLAYAV